MGINKTEFPINHLTKLNSKLVQLCELKTLQHLCDFSKRFYWLKKINEHEGLLMSYICIKEANSKPKKNIVPLRTPQKQKTALISHIIFFQTFLYIKV